MGLGWGRKRGGWTLAPEWWTVEGWGWTPEPGWQPVRGSREDQALVENWTLVPVGEMHRSQKSNRD